MSISPMSMIPSSSMDHSNALGISATAGPEEVAKSFEAVFASMLIKEMRNTLSEGLFGSEGSDVFGGLFDLHIGNAMTEGRGLGIKELVLSQLEQQQADANGRIDGQE